MARRINDPLADSGLIGEYELTEDELMVYKNIFPLISQEASVQRLDRFKNISSKPGYSSTAVEADKSWVRSWQEKESKRLEELRRDDYQGYEFESNVQMRAKILERIVVDQIERADWLGGNCYTSKVEPYDDRKAHTDLVLEWEMDDGRIVRLAVDVTVSGDYEVFLHKIDLIKTDIVSGSLTNLKYFHSEAEDKDIGELKSIPRVVIGTSHDEVKRLSSLFLKAGYGESGNRKESLAQLAQDRTALEFLNIIKMQLVRGILEVVNCYAQKLRINGTRFKNLAEQKVYQQIIQEAGNMRQGSIEGMQALLEKIKNNQSLFDQLPEYNCLTLLDKHQEMLDIIQELIDNRTLDEDFRSVIKKAKEDMGVNGTYQRLISNWPI